MVHYFVSDGYLYHGTFKKYIVNTGSSIKRAISDLQKKTAIHIMKFGAQKALYVLLVKLLLVWRDTI